MSLGKAQLDIALKNAYDEAEKTLGKVIKKYFKDAKGRDDNILLRQTLSSDRLIEQAQGGRDFLEKKRAGHQRWTKVLAIVLKPVERLGDVVAGIASAAFPGSPTGLALNAVSFLIQAGNDVSASYDALSDLFGEVGEALIRFQKLTEERIDEDLMQIIHRVFISFITICALSVKFLKGGIIKNWARALVLGREAEIQEQVALMQKLSRREDSMVGVLTLKEVMGTRASIERLGNELPEMQEDIKGISRKMSEFVVIEKKRELSASHQEQLIRLEKRFGSKTSTDVREVLSGILREQVPQTGSWLRTHRLFQAWTRGETPVLAICGDSGSGKSFLSANVVQYLLDLFPQLIQHVSRTSVAYHFCKSNNPNLRNMKDALLSMAHMIAQNDPIFAAFFDGESKSSEDISTVEQVWRKLFIGFFRVASPENQVFIVVEGLEQVSSQEREGFLKLLEDLTSLQEKESPCSIHVLLVEQPSTEKPLRQLLGPQVPVIKITAALNEDDIKLYATKAVKEVRMWRIDEKLSANIIESLTKSTQGNFLLVNYKIQDLRRYRRPGDIQAALLVNPKSLPDAIRDDLRRLAEGLENWEIDELEALLRAVICGKGTFDLAAIRECVRVQGGGYASFGSLESQLRTRYASVFNVVREDGKTTEDLRASPLFQDITGDAGNISEDIDFLDIRSDPQTTYVELANASIGTYFTEQMDENTRNASSDVQEAEVKIVERFLKSVCDDELYKRFGFAEFFEQKLTQKLAPICVNLQEGTTILLVMCLTIIAELEGEYQAVNLKMLRRHAIAWFPEYVSSTVLDNQPIDRKEDVICHILPVFRDEVLIKRWARDNEYLALDWLRKDDKTDKVLSWFSDNEILDQLKDIKEYEESISWAQEVTLGRKPNGGRRNHLLRPTMEVIAKEWLQNTEWDAGIAYATLRDYIGYVENVTLARDVLAGEEGTYRALNIVSVAKWAAFPEDSRWHERVGATFNCLADNSATQKCYSAIAFEGEDHIEAAQHFETALNLDNSNWRAHGGLGIAYMNQKTWVPALEAFGKALLELEHLPDGIRSYQTEHNKYIYLRADCFEWADQLDEAAEYYHQVSELTPEDHLAGACYIRVLSSQHRYLEIIKFWQTMETQTMANTKLLRIEEFFCDRSADQGFFICVVQAARLTQNLDYLRNIYQRAIDAATRKAWLEICGNLRMNYARLLQRHYGKEDEAEMVEAFETVLRSTTPSSGDRDVWFTSDEATKGLAKFYVDKARSAGAGSAVAGSNIQKLIQLQATVSAGFKDDDKESLIGETIGRITLLLGRWYAQEEKDDAHARRYIKSHIIIGLDLLSDSNPYNDSYAFQMLAMAFMYYGDDVNSLAAWSRLGQIDAASETHSESDEDAVLETDSTLSEPTTLEADDGQHAISVSTGGEHQESSTIEGEEAASTSKPDVLTPSGPLHTSPEPHLASKDWGLSEWTPCSGTCDTKWRVADDFYICKICPYTIFDEACLRSLNDGTLGVNVCGTDHEWLHVPKVDAPLPKGTVRLAGESVPVQDWKNRIAREWGI